ncbi:unnamed protein product [Enterobius vermicularis]|uniref:Uncharacterized protein n=1 Tax=Enterobius vermicularis TaxID=51028 RepID=A0A0N4UT79_ENTVE|nr:unnamed protein product [Enterobius vermicularis]
MYRRDSKITSQEFLKCNNSLYYKLFVTPENSYFLASLIVHAHIFSRFPNSSKNSSPVPKTISKHLNTFIPHNSVVLLLENGKNSAFKFRNGKYKLIADQQQLTVKKNITTNRCQPQCRSSVANLYNNRFGRTLLRTDLSCLQARHELEICNLMPNKTPLHCNLARLACESDLQQVKSIKLKS